LDNEGYTSYHDVLEAYVEIHDRNLIADEDQLCIGYNEIFNQVIQNAGFYALYDMSNIYFCKTDDKDCKVYRIDEIEDVWDDIYTYSNYVQKYSINTNPNITQILSNSKGIVAATLPGSGLFVNAIENFDKSKYDAYLLYDNREKYQSQFMIFAVNEACADKQAAVQYIDWLYSDPTANMMIRYGIEGVNFKIDPVTSLMHYDDIAQLPSLGLFPDYLLNNHILNAESFYFNNYDASLYEKGIGYYQCLPISKLLILSRILDSEEAYMAGMNKLLYELPLEPEWSKDYTLGRRLPYEIFVNKVDDMRQRVRDTCDIHLLQEIHSILDNEVEKWRNLS